MHLELLQVLFLVQVGDVVAHLLVEGLARLWPVNPVEADVAQGARQAVPVVDRREGPLPLRFPPHQHVRPVSVGVRKPDVQDGNPVHPLPRELRDPHLLAVRLVRNERLDAPPFPLRAVPVRDARVLLVGGLLQAHHGGRRNSREVVVVEDVRRKLPARPLSREGSLSQALPPSAARDPHGLAPSPRVVLGVRLLVLRLEDRHLVSPGAKEEVRAARSRRRQAGRHVDVKPRLGLLKHFHAVLEAPVDVLELLAPLRHQPPVLPDGLQDQDGVLIDAVIGQRGRLGQVLAVVNHPVRQGRDALRHLDPPLQGLHRLRRGYRELELVPAVGQDLHLGRPLDEDVDDRGPREGGNLREGLVVLEHFALQEDVLVVG
mmetsp:Transcript_11616/g.32204  ORF Transcript_11616/g.32204 Transcript_11616/m.32204 type:complete len:374 (-) Transcript_11616:176-1297(-)